MGNRILCPTACYRGPGTYKLLNIIGSNTWLRRSASERMWWLFDGDRFSCMDINPANYPARNTCQDLIKGWDWE